MVEFFWERDVQIEFSLQDLPDIYQGEEYNAVVLGVGNIAREIDHHSESKHRRVTTSLEEDLQKVELAWDGPKIDDITIKRINLGYTTGRQLSNQPHQSGTLIASFFLNKVKGRVRIENFQNGIYVVRNVIELPVNYK